MNNLHAIFNTKNNLFCFQNERNNAGSTPNNENTIPDKSSPLLAAFSEVTNTLLEESSQHHWISRSTKVKKKMISLKKGFVVFLSGFFFQETPKLRNSITYYLVNDEYVFWQNFFSVKKEKKCFCEIVDVFPCYKYIASINHA